MNPYKLSLHECQNIESGLAITRVPGGWIYHLDSGHCFVPFHNEFMENSEDNGTQPTIDNKARQVPGSEQPSTQICPRCRGSGFDPERHGIGSCSKCGGTGKLLPC